MKTKRTKFYLSLLTQRVLLMTFFALFINSCTDEVENGVSKENELSNSLLIKNFNSDELEVYQTFKNTIFSFKADKSNDVVTSRFAISTLDDEIAYETEYTVNFNEDNYKLNQTDKVLDIANKIEYGFKQKTYE